MTVSVEELAAQVRWQSIDAAVRRISTTLRVDADQLLDSRAFAESVRTLDPAHPDFSTRIRAAIQDASDTDPRFRAASAVPQSGANPQQWTDANVAKATPSEIKKAIDDGLLNTLGVGSARQRHR